jgi:hypothetical protein
MSGSDSGYENSNSVGNFSGGAVACDSLAFETALSSPKPKIISQLSIGDILDITIQRSGGIETIVAIYSGQIAGGLVINSIQIISCINQGFNYEAEVREIKGALVKLFVRPA